MNKNRKKKPTKKPQTKRNAIMKPKFLFGKMKEQANNIPAMTSKTNKIKSNNI